MDVFNKKTLTFKNHTIEYVVFNYNLTLKQYVTNKTTNDIEYKDLCIAILNNAFRLKPNIASKNALIVYFLNVPNLTIEALNELMDYTLSLNTDIETYIVKLDNEDLKESLNACGYSRIPMYDFYFNKRIKQIICKNCNTSLNVIKGQNTCPNCKSAITFKANGVFYE